MIKRKSEANYFSSFDFLRVFFAVSVVAWHTKALGATALVTDSFSLNVKDFIYGSVLLLAVPTFVQISLFLYLLNRQEKSNYFLKRIADLSFLFLFWIALLIMVFYQRNGLGTFKDPIFWFSGGRTPLYFLLVVLILTIVTELFALIKNKLSKQSFLILILFLLVASILSIVGKNYFYDLLNPQLRPFVMSHWSVFNFLPYVFSSFIFVDLYQRKTMNRNFLMILMLGIIISGVAILEYLYLPSTKYLEFGMIVPAYSRLSLFLSTWLVFYLAISKDYRFNNAVNQLAGLTLGIYVLHIFVMNILAGLMPGRIDLIRETPLYFGLVLAGAALGAFLIQKKRIV